MTGEGVCDDVPGGRVSLLISPSLKLALKSLLLSLPFFLDTSSGSSPTASDSAILFRNATNTGTITV